MLNQENVFVHSTAVIDYSGRRQADPIVIGNGTRIWHFCHICAGANIGKDCHVGQNVYIGPGVHIGDNCKIQNNVSIYKGVTIEDNVFVGPSCVFTNVHLPDPRVPAGEFHQTMVRSGVMLGANSTIVAPCLIGQNAIVGAGSVVTEDVPENTMVYGNPAKYVKSL